ncbi:MAG TPA: trypsin-like peptidase domain-containing protein [Usitatibacter sp.]|nr:trypsin-like peptidase domain-containing protein [Usitatibacter sp.]
MMMAPMAQAKKTLYDILGAPRDATPIDIGLAHERRTAEFQRAVPQDPSAEALLHEAYEVLSDPARRAAYDASLVTAEERAAAAQQSEPDLVIEDEPVPARKRLSWPVIAVGAVVVLAILYFALRPGRLPDPDAKKPEPVAEAPKPVPPPPPKALPAADILKQASVSSGKLVSVEMSGRSVPIGIAVATEPNAMVTTCHGIQAGGKLVVVVGTETYAADLANTDETLDLCRLTVAGMNARPFAIATDEPRAGDKIIAVGMNASGQLAATEGTIKKLIAAPNGKVLEISVPVAATASGGGVFDPYGRLVGIATTPHAYGPNLHVALPASWIAQIRSRGRSQ